MFASAKMHIVTLFALEMHIKIPGSSSCPNICMEKFLKTIFEANLHVYSLPNLVC
jgi:hypothetical protein